MGVLGGIDCKRVKEKKNFLINLFIYFRLPWVFVAACGLSLVVVRAVILFFMVHGL